MHPKTDNRTLTTDQQAQVEQWQVSHDQLQKMEDMALILQEILGLLDDNKKSGDKSTTNFATLMMDMRESLSALKGKKDPQTPDFAKPLDDAVVKLDKAFEKAVSKLDLTPNISVNAPDVNITAAQVDLKGVEKVLKTDIPEAFRAVMETMPQPETYNDKTVVAQLKKINTTLESIDIASRLKPNGPGVSSGGGGAVTNDGTFATPANQTSEITKLTSIDGKLTDVATQTTLALIKAKTDNLDVALSTRAVTGLTDTQLRATPVPVSSSSLPLPTGASTSAKQLPDNHNVVVTSAPTTAVTGTFFQATQPVSAATLPLPSGASTAANQATGNSSLSSIDTKLSGTIATSSSTLPQADLPAAPVNNQKTVITAGTAVQLQTNTLKVGVIVQALSTNTGLIYVGSSSVSAANGFELQPGQATSVGAANTNSIWLDASVNGDKVCWIGS